MTSIVLTKQAVRSWLNQIAPNYCESLSLEEFRHNYLSLYRILYNNRFSANGVLPDPNFIASEIGKGSFPLALFQELMPLYTTKDVSSNFAGVYENFIDNFIEHRDCNRTSDQIVSTYLVQNGSDALQYIDSEASACKFPEFIEASYRIYEKLKV